MLTDASLAKQFRSKTCTQEVVNDRHEILNDIDSLVEMRYPMCKNKETTDGWNIGQYSPSDIFILEEDNLKWCYRISDVEVLHSSGKNLYTGAPLTRESLVKIDTLRAKIPRATYPVRPLESQLRDLDTAGRCPVWSSDDSNIVYSYARKDDAKVTILRNASPTISMGKLGNVGQVYKLKLKKPYTGKELEDADVESYEVIMDGSSVEHTLRPLDSEKRDLDAESKAGVFLTKYLDFESIGSPASLYIMSAFKPNGPVILYRGLSFKKDTLNNFLGRKGVKIGDKLPYKPKHAVESWSTNVCVALDFATELVPKYNSDVVGLVMRYIATPLEVVADTRRIKNFSDFFSDQAEVILTNYPLSQTTGERTSEEVIIRSVEVYLLVNSTEGNTNLWARRIQTT